LHNNVFYRIIRHSTNVSPRYTLLRFKGVQNVVKRGSVVIRTIDH